MRKFGENKMPLKLYFAKFIEKTRLKSKLHGTIKLTSGATILPALLFSTSPVFHRGETIFKKFFPNKIFEICYITNIGNNVWLGSETITEAVDAISDKSIVGVESVETKDFGPYDIWAGNHEKLINRSDIK